MSQSDNFLKNMKNFFRSHATKKRKSEVLNFIKEAAKGKATDFNSDGKVNLVDYEIWRNTVYH